MYFHYLFWDMNFSFQIAISSTTTTLPTTSTTGIDTTSTTGRELQIAIVFGICQSTIYGYILVNGVLIASSTRIECFVCSSLQQTSLANIPWIIHSASKAMLSSSNHVGVCRMSTRPSLRPSLQLLLSISSQNLNLSSIMLNKPALFIFVSQIYIYSRSQWRIFYGKPYINAHKLEHFLLWIR